MTLAGHTHTIFHVVFAIGQTAFLPASIFALDRAPLRLADGKHFVASAQNLALGPFLFPRGI